MNLPMISCLSLPPPLRRCFLLFSPCFFLILCFLLLVHLQSISSSNIHNKIAQNFHKLKMVSEYQRKRNENREKVYGNTGTEEDEGMEEMYANCLILYRLESNDVGSNMMFSVNTKEELHRVWKGSVEVYNTSIRYLSYIEVSPFLSGKGPKWLKNGRYWSCTTHNVNHPISLNFHFIYPLSFRYVG